MHVLFTLVYSAGRTSIYYLYTIYTAVQRRGELVLVSLYYLRCCILLRSAFIFFFLGDARSDLRGRDGWAPRQFGAVSYYCYCYCCCCCCCCYCYCYHWTHWRVSRVYTNSTKLNYLNQTGARRLLDALKSFSRGMCVSVCVCMLLVLVCRARVWASQCCMACRCSSLSAPPLSLSRSRSRALSLSVYSLHGGSR